jgi:hypothetical protein
VIFPATTGTSAPTSDLSQSRGTPTAAPRSTARYTSSRAFAAARSPGLHGHEHFGAAADGVWFRDEPNTPGPRLNGYGVYMGDRVQLQCYGWGQAIGQYNNRLWYRSANLTRPSAPGRSNVGWLNAHFINDGSNTNVVDAGVPPC